jgi:hypothetical protein
MAIDTIKHRVFIAYRHPANLIIVDCKTGDEIASTDMAGDADDLYYDYDSAEVFASCGDGYINIFQQDGNNVYKQIANIASGTGARTSLFIPSLKLFVVASRATSGMTANLLVYQIAH